MELIEQLDKLVIGDLPKNHTAIVWKVALFADCEQDQFILIIKNVNYQDDSSMFHHHNLYYIADLELTMVFANNLVATKLKYLTPVNLASWPYDYGNNIRLYMIMSNEDFKILGYLSFQKCEDILIKDSPGEIVLFEDPMYGTQVTACLCVT